MNKKTIFLITGIFAVLSAGIYVWLVLSNSNIKAPIEKPFITQEIKLPERWHIYKDEAYKFQIEYPDKGWLLTTNMGQPEFYSHYSIKKEVDLYTQRSVPTQGPISAPIIIAIYDKPSTITPIQWLSKGYGINLANIKKGGIETALAIANQGTESTIISYQERKEGGMNIYEVGSYVD